VEQRDREPEIQRPTGTGKKETGSHRERGRSIDREPQRQGNTDTGRHRDSDSQRQGNIETGRNRDMETRRKGKIDTGEY
jgi:hypothetical protein